MKNVITYHFIRKQEDIKTILEKQIKISLYFGWKPEDILIITNRKFKTEGVESIFLDQERIPWSRYIYRTYAFLYLFKELKISCPIWYHDWDAIQTEPLDFHFEKDKDIALYYGFYYKRKKRPNGGSMFIRPSFTNMLEKWLALQLKTKRDTTEPSLEQVLSIIQEKVQFLPEELNIGSTGLRKRFKKAKKPIKVWHFKMTRPKYNKMFLPRLISQAKTNKNTAFVLKILKEFYTEFNYKFFDIKNLTESF